MGVVYIVLTIVAALFFYRLRGLHPFVYGICEIAVALTVIFLTFYPQTTFLITENETLWASLLSRSVGVLGGIYIFVRGMDNVEKDLPPVWRRWWERHFPKLASRTPQ